MYLIDVILKLIKTLALLDSEKYSQLKVDCVEWEESAKAEIQKEEPQDKLKVLYAKLHQGVLVRLITPFIYFFLLGWVRNLTSPENDDNFLDD